MPTRRHGRNVYRPEDFNYAKGGGTDDSLAFAAMMQAIEAETSTAFSRRGVVVELSQADYILESAPWRITHPLRVQGVGRGDLQVFGTRIITSSTFSAIVLDSYGSAAFPASTAGEASISDIAVVYAGVSNQANYGNFPGHNLANVLYGTPFPRWRPSRTIKVGTRIVPAKLSQWHANNSTGNCPDWGWAFTCTRAGGSYTFGAAGTSGATEPDWLQINPRSATGTARSFTANAGTDFLTCASHGFANGDCIRLSTSGALPTATGGDLAAFTSYFVRDVAGNDFKLARTSGGAAIDITGAGSGTHSCFSYIHINLSPIVDNDLEWTPFMSHGIDVKAHVRVNDVQIHGFPSNGLNVNASSLYAQHPSVLDPAGGQDYCNANTCRFTNITAHYNGGSGVFVHGYDANQIVFSGINVDYNRFGVYDGGAFINTHIGAHADANDHSYYGRNSSHFVGCYVEGPNGLPIMQNASKWDHGVSFGFTGSKATQTYPPHQLGKWQPGLEVESTVNGWDVVEPTVDNGFLYAAVPDYVQNPLYASTGVVSAASACTFASGTDVVTYTGHTLATGQRVRFGTTTGGVTAATNYFAGDIASNTFKAYTDPALTSLVNLTADVSNTVVVCLNTGGVPFTVNAGTDVVTTPRAHGFSSGDKVRLRSEGTLPGGLTALVDRWVGGGGDFTATTFKVYSDAGLTSLVDITSAGSGVHWVGKEPVWPAFVDHWSQDIRNGTQYYLDTYPQTADGSTRWRGYCLSTKSYGVLETGSTAWNQEFKNRDTGERFFPGGIVGGAGAVYSWKGPVDSVFGDGNWGLIYDPDRRSFVYQLNGSAAFLAQEFTNAGHTVGQGHSCFPRGLYFGPGTPGGMISVDSVPANGSQPQGVIAIHRDAASAEPAMWQANGDGTWTTLFNKP